MAEHKPEASLFIKAINESKGIRCFGETSLIKLKEFSRNIESANVFHRDRPDIIVDCNTIVYLVEHFEFDSSMPTKKGTMVRKESAEIQRKFDKQIAENASKSKISTIHHSATYKSKQNKEYYISNFIRNYSRHYSKCDSYVSNSFEITNGRHVELGFFIVNSSIICDSVLVEPGNIQLLLPIHLSRILDFLCEKPKVQHIFYLTNDCSSGKMLFYFHVSEMLKSDLINENVPNYDTYNIIDWDVHCTGATIVIPRE